MVPLGRRVHRAKALETRYDRVARCLDIQAARDGHRVAAGRPPGSGEVHRRVARCLLELESRPLRVDIRVRAACDSNRSLECGGQPSQVQAASGDVGGALACLCIQRQIGGPADGARRRNHIQRLELHARSGRVVDSLALHVQIGEPVYGEILSIHPDPRFELCDRAGGRESDVHVTSQRLLHVREGNQRRERQRSVGAHVEPGIVEVVDAAAQRDSGIAQTHLQVLDVRRVLLQQHARGHAAHGQSSSFEADLASAARLKVDLMIAR